ncbi:MAG TPA: SDR family NAD(P)-dependent oxidoreductase [Streptosporangiaceae bacterium]|nr:SDR family NAD(P)-dependent oxidoreductase [Streptosporangiaceae bacterium]
MRVLVTGAAGYVGYAVGRRLVDAGHDVAGLIRRPAQTRRLPGEVVPVVADLLDYGNLRAAVTTVARHELGGPLDGVCHLAGLARVRESFADPLAYFAANVQGTVNLLRSLPENAHVVLGSTGAVYGSPEVQPITEAQPPAPASPYAASKLAAEEVLRYHARTERAGAVVLRTFNVAGSVDDRPDPDESRLVGKALDVAAGRLPHLTVNGDGTAVREFVHVDDLAAAYVLALEAAARGLHRVFNVGSGTGTSVRDVVATVAEITGRPVPTVSAPPAPEPPLLMADSSAIRDELGWTPKRSDLRQIISDAWAARRAS